jgi:hypothetical protein
MIDELMVMGPQDKHGGMGRLGRGESSAAEVKQAIKAQRARRWREKEKGWEQEQELELELVGSGSH